MVCKEADFYRRSFSCRSNSLARIWRLTFETGAFGLP
jgi:hypothetical protein